MARTQVKGKTANVVTASVWLDGQLAITEFRGWGATAKIDKDQLPDELPPEIFTAVRDLLTNDGMALLREHKRIRNEAKGWLYRNSMPFPVSNMCFVRNSTLAKAEEVLTDFQRQALEVSEEFIKVAKKLELEYAEKYPAFYVPAKYPSEAQLRSRFVFQWTFRSMMPPDEQMKQLLPDMYDREISKFNQDIKWMKNATSKMFADAVIDRLGQLKKQCEDGTVYTQTIDSVNALIEKFDTVFDGYVDRENLTTLMDDVKMYMDGTDAEMLRIDDTFRTVMRKKMTEVVDTFVNEAKTIELSRGFEL